MAIITKLAQHNDKQGQPQTRTIGIANERGVRLLTNKEFDGRLVHSDVWKSEKEVYPAWTGTYVAFKDKDQKLGDVVKYIDPNTDTTYIFEVPKEYQNERNAILVAQHGFLSDGKPILSLKEDGKNVLVDVADKGQIVLLPDFPSRDGWYIADDRFGIPVGSKAFSSDQGARYLWRVDTYSGLLARGDDQFYYDYRAGVFAKSAPSYCFGGIVVDELRSFAKQPREKARNGAKVEKAEVKIDEKAQFLAGARVIIEEMRHKGVDEKLIAPLAALIDWATKQRDTS